MSIPRTTRSIRFHGNNTRRGTSRTHWAASRWSMSLRATNSMGFPSCSWCAATKTRKEVALTFDDGPHPPFTERLLDLLKQLNVQATFFVVGRKVDAAPEILARMVAEKHEVANHTYHHVNLKTLPYGLVENEIRLDNDAIRRACGQGAAVFPPAGRTAQRRSGGNRAPIGHEYDFMDGRSRRLRQSGRGRD